MNEPNQDIGRFFVFTLIGLFMFVLSLFAFFNENSWFFVIFLMNLVWTVFLTWFFNKHKSKEKEQ